MTGSCWLSHELTSKLLLMWFTHGTFVGGLPSASAQPSQPLVFGPVRSCPKCLVLTQWLLSTDIRGRVFTLDLSWRAPVDHACVRAGSPSVFNFQFGGVGTSWVSSSVDCSRCSAVCAPGMFIVLDILCAPASSEFLRKGLLVRFRHFGKLFFAWRPMFITGSRPWYVTSTVCMLTSQQTVDQSRGRTQYTCGAFRLVGPVQCPHRQQMS